MAAKSVNEYLDKFPHWRAELECPHKLFSETNLDEDIKWGLPTYSFKGKNVAGFAAFKNHFAIWFFQGSFLKDQSKVLVNAQEGKTKVLRQWRFESMADINEELILEYIHEAIQNQLKGKEVKIERSATYKMPPVLESCLSLDDYLKSSFYKLSMSKQKDYSNYITDSKREATKVSRIEKVTPMILNGAGLHDKYKNC
jgi:uncharacterized protein YdeI (YjbR/CyaY-like superfamily)